jgi:hypothetical protein
MMVNRFNKVLSIIETPRCLHEIIGIIGIETPRCLHEIYCLSLLIVLQNIDTSWKDQVERVRQGH